MKKRILIFAGILAATLLLAAGCSSQRKATGTPAEKAELKSAIDSGNYKITVNMAYPTSGRSMSLTSEYSLEVKDGEVVSHLPYFGRAYSVPYGGGEGLMFTGKADEYEVTYGKGGEAEISFKVQTREDLYKFNVEVFPGGSAYVNVSSNNRHSIAYSGSLDM